MLHINLIVIILSIFIYRIDYLVNINNNILPLQFTYLGLITVINTMDFVSLQEKFLHRWQPSLVLITGTILTQKQTSFCGDTQENSGPWRRLRKVWILIYYCLSFLCRYTLWKTEGLVNKMMSIIIYFLISSQNNNDCYVQSIIMNL